MVIDTFPSSIFVFEVKGVEKLKEGDYPGAAMSFRLDGCFIYSKKGFIILLYLKSKSVKLTFDWVWVYSKTQ